MNSVLVFGLKPLCTLGTLQPIRLSTLVASSLYEIKGCQNASDARRSGLGEEDSRNY